jgi:hypothetical protein
MPIQQKHLLQDIVFLLISISVAFFISISGAVNEFVFALNQFHWLGIFLSGMFFTSIFTTAPAIILLGQFAQTTPILLLALLGGLGAVTGDYVLFRLMRNRIKDDFDYILSFRKENRFTKIFETRLFKFFVPSLGAMVIASPLPDEIGIAMLGLSDVNSRTFLFISFLLNVAGIFAIGVVATTTTI